MKTIYKYKLNHRYEQQISTQGDATPLCVQMMDKECCMWAMVDTEKPPSTIDVYMIGTGCQMPDRCVKYLDSCQMNGSLIFHFFWNLSDVTDAGKDIETI
jgi:hypothetical protein